MVQIEGCWKVQVVCLIVLAIIIAVLWVSMESGSDHEARLFSGCATACVFAESDATGRLIKANRAIV